MKLYKALKLKKKITGEISMLMHRIRESNSYVIGTPVKYDVAETYAELIGKIEKLTRLKMAIYKANIPIQPDIYRLAELKSLIAMWSGLSVMEGKAIVGLRDRELEYAVQLDVIERDKKVAEIQAEIDATQEKIDAYNYSVEAEFEG